MSVIATPTLAVPSSPAVSRPPPHHAAPSHSILRPCNKQGIPIGPPVINPPAVSVSIPNGAPAKAPGSAVPSSPTASNRTVSSTDSLSAPSHSTASTAPSTSPSASAASTLASSVSGMSDVCETESNAESTTSSAGASTPRSSVVCQSPKIRFGHCPERPPELRRRNSITLGVLARKNMLHAQGTIPASSSSGGHNKVYMTDAEWEAYQQKFAKPNTAPAVDLGAVVSSGAKNFWRKVRRGSNASVASNASVSSTASAAPGPRGRSDSSTSQAGSISPRIGPVDVAAPIEEEEEPHSAPGSPRGSALHLSKFDGDETPGRRRSPSPDVSESAVYDDEDDSFSNTARSPTSSNGDAVVHPHQPHHHQQYQYHNHNGHNNNDHLHDDADAEHESHKSSSTAALGFEYNEYSKRPTWGRRGSGSGPVPQVQPVPHSHPRLI